MTVNIPINEFEEKWYLADRGEDVYTNGKLYGKIQYEDERYIVIKLVGK